MTECTPVDRSGAPVLASATSRCRVLGVINVTPDSFSDGGRYLDVDAAVSRGLALVHEGADIVDVGGESTRPGARRISESEELRRVVPVVRALCDQGVSVSVDTMRANVAAAAIECGAVMVNDVSGGLADPAMLSLLADSRTPCILMHWRAHSETMDRHATYDNVATDVREELSRRVDAALARDIEPENIVLDPGLGFAKTADQSWSLLAGMSAVQGLGFPLVVGASRKRFLAEVIDYGGLDPAHPVDRDDASGAVTAIVAAAGAWGVRVHRPAPSAAAVRVAARLAGVDREVH